MSTRTESTHQVTQIEAVVATPHAKCTHALTILTSDRH
jgi:hypothetical protein